MTMLQMYACEGCGAAIDPRIGPAGIARIPDDWLVVEGPAVEEEVEESSLNAPERHVCSPACLVVLAQRLAELPDAIQPVAEMDASPIGAPLQPQEAVEVGATGSPPLPGRPPR